MPGNARALVSAAAVLLVVAGLSLGGYVACQSPSYEDPCKGEPTQSNTVEYANQVMETHSRLLFGQANVAGFGAEFFTGSGIESSRPGPGVTGKWGILIEVVGEKIDQSTLPEEERIPDCLDGVPVRWKEDGEFTLPAWGGE